MKSFKIQDLVYMALGAVLITVCAWISIPMAVPFTLQTFAVFLVLGLLGGKRGTISLVVYLLLGAVGVPVFAGFKGGIGALIGTTGGYIIGFLLMALVYWLAEHLIKMTFAAEIITMAVCLLVCYAFGTAWFMVIYTGQSGPIGLGTALGWCVLPFIIPDIAKMVLAVIVSGRLKKALHI